MITSAPAKGNEQIVITILINRNRLCVVHRQTITVCVQLRTKRHRISEGKY